MPEKKIKIAWYEYNMYFVDPILPYIDHEKFDVKIFGSSNKSEKEILRYRPDLIIFEYRMKPKNGVEMLKSLKNKGLDFGIIFFTVWGNDEYIRKEIMDAGVESDKIFDKHIEPDSFSNVLYDYCKRINEKWSCLTKGS